MQVRIKNIEGYKLEMTLYSNLGWGEVFILEPNEEREERLFMKTYRQGSRDKTLCLSDGHFWYTNNDAVVHRVKAKLQAIAER